MTIFISWSWSWFEQGSQQRKTNWVGRAKETALGQETIKHSLKHYRRIHTKRHKHPPLYSGGWGGGGVKEKVAYVFHPNTLFLLLLFSVPVDSSCTTLVSGWVPPFHTPLPNPQNQKRKWAEDTFYFPKLQWVKPKKPCRKPEPTVLRLVLAVSRKTCRKKIHFLQGHQPLEHAAPRPLHCSEPAKI